MSSKLQQIIEEWLPEMHDVPTEFDTGSENSTPRLIRANGYNNAIKDIKSKIPQLEQSIVEIIEATKIKNYEWQRQRLQNVEEGFEDTKKIIINSLKGK